MMAVLGFILVLLAGCVFLAYAIIAAYVTSAFSGRIEWPPFLVFGGFGVACLYFAFKYAQFTISFAGVA